MGKKGRSFAIRYNAKRKRYRKNKRYSTQYRREMGFWKSIRGDIGASYHQPKDKQTIDKKKLIVPGLKAVGRTVRRMYRARNSNKSFKHEL